MKTFELSLKLTEEQIKMLMNRRYRKGKKRKQTIQQQQEKNKIFK